MKWWWCRKTKTTPLFFALELVKIKNPTMASNIEKKKKMRKTPPHNSTPINSAASIRFIHLDIRNKPMYSKPYYEIKVQFKIVFLFSLPSFTNILKHSSQLNSINLNETNKRKKAKKKKMCVSNQK